MDRRKVRRAAARLRNLGRLVPTGRSEEERLREARQVLRSEQVYEAAAVCPHCAAARRCGDDETALCAAHLAEALGL